MNIQNELDNNLLKQSFIGEDIKADTLDDCKNIARLYSITENSLAVLSDMKSDMSYIYYGNTGEILGLGKKGSCETIESIWESKIIERIHPDDYIEKQIQELRFFHFIKNIDIYSRTDYHAIHSLRMKNDKNEYLPIIHKIYYLASHSNGSIWLTLCLYNLADKFHSQESAIINSATAKAIYDAKDNDYEILSKREIEILSYINIGMQSKDIAENLFISVHTVNRHRQNILQKLHVSNSFEACKIAKAMNLL